MLGRAFTEPDATTGADQFAILTYGLWNSRFAADVAVVGKDIRLDGVACRVVGVLPPDLELPARDIALLVPFSFTSEQMSELLARFGAVALLLSGIGIYGVVAYGVAQRVREFGIRQALGADRQTILQMVLRQGVRTAILGVALGLVSAVALTRFLQSQLYGVGAQDPLVFVVAGTTLLAASIPWWPCATADDRWTASGESTQDGRSDQELPAGGL